MGMFDDLEPQAPQGGMFDDLEKPVATRGLGGIALAGALGTSADIGRGAALVGGAVLPRAAQDWVTRNVADPLGEYSAKKALTPEESGSLANRVAFGLGGVAPLLAAQLIPVVGEAADAGMVARLGVSAAKMAVPATFMGTSHAANLIQQGVDPVSAMKAGAVDAALNTATAAVPFGMTGKLATRTAVTAGIGAATSEAGRLAQNAALSEYPDQQAAFDWKGAASSAIIGGALGAVFGRNTQEKARVNKALEGAKNDLATADAGQPLVPMLPEEPAVAKQTPDQPGGADLHAELGVQSGMDQIAQEATAQKAAQAEQDARVQGATLPDDLPKIEPVIARNQGHAEDIANLRDAGIEPTGDPIQDRALAYDTFEKPPAEAAAPDVAQPEPKTEQQRAEEEIAYGQKSAQDDQRAENADALARVNSDALRTPMQVAFDVAQEVKARDDATAQARAEANRQVQDNYVASLQDVLPEGMSKSAKTTVENELRKLVDGKDTPEAQLAALGAKVASLEKTKPNRYEYFKSLYDNLTAAKEAANEPKPAEAAPAEAVQAEAQGSQPPAIVDVTKPLEAAPALAGDPVDALQTAADRLTAARAALNDKARTSDGLTDLEKTRSEDMAGVQKSIQDIQDKAGGNNKYSEDHVAAVTEFAHDLADGKDNLPLKAANPEDRSLGLITKLVEATKLSDVLIHLSTEGSEPWVKDLATKLNGLGLDTTIRVSGTTLAPKVAGNFDVADNHINIMRGGESEHTVLHEAVHAGTATKINEAQDITTPRNQAEAKLKASYDALESVRKEALQHATADDHYGLTNAHEFMAELHSSTEFQDFLRGIGAQKSLWQRAVDGVRKLLGLEPGAANALEKAMSLQDSFFSDRAARAEARQFNASPAGAAKTTDLVLQRVLKGVDDNAEDKGGVLARMGQYAFKKFMGAPTVQNIAQYTGTLPEMRQFGMDRGVQAYHDANENLRKVANVSGQRATEFMQAGQKIMRDKTGDEVRASNKRMAQVATDSSAGAFEPDKNWADNLIAHPELAKTGNAKFVGDTFRNFQRLPPEEQQAVLDGAKVNRGNYIADTATVLKNLIGAKSNSASAARVMSHYAAGLDILDPSLKAEVNGDTAKFMDGASYALSKHIEAVFDAAKTLPEGDPLREQIAAWESAHRNAVANPYFSMGRSGEHYANVGFKNMDDAGWDKVRDALHGTNILLGDHTGQDHIFMKFDTSDQAAGVRNKLIAALGDKYAEGTASNGRLADNAKLNNAAPVSQALRSVLAALHASVDDNPNMPAAQADAVKAVMTRKLLDMLPDTSTQMSKVQRAGVPGYTGDFYGNFGKRAAGAAWDTAHIYSAPHFADAFDQMGTSVAAMNHTGSEEMKGKARSILDELNLRHSNDMHPNNGNIVNTINSFGSTMFIAGAPAFYLRTMTQPWHRGMPYLGGLYGFVKSAKELAGATPIAIKVIKATMADGWSADRLRGVVSAGMKFDGLGLPATEAAFMQEMHDRGVFKLGLAQQLQSMDMAGSSKTQDFIRIAALTAQYAEMTNRVITGLAAFRLAQKATPEKGVMANTDGAHIAVNTIMDNFDSANTSRWLGSHNPVTGSVTPLMTQFMQYQMQAMGQIFRATHDGFFGSDTSAAGLARAAAAKKEFAGLMATSGVLAGAMGLPFVGAIAGVYNMLTKDEDNPEDIREAMRNHVAKWVGVPMGNVIAHGIGAVPQLWGGSGVSTSTMGLQNLLPGTDFLDNRGLLKDRLAAQSEALMGPALNGVINLAKGGALMSDGLYMKGLEQMLPNALKGYYKAGELATMGYTDSKGNPTGLMVTGGDIAWQALGFQPADKATASEAQGYSIADQEIRQHRAQVIKDQFLKADGDPAAMAEATQALTAFNAKNPYQPITGQDITSAYRMHAMEVMTGLSSGTGVGAASGRQLAQQQSRLGFAAMPRN